MRLDDLHPFVLPYVTQMPIPTVEHHLRLSANEFFNKTLAWQEDLEPFDSAKDVREYDLDVASGADVVRVLHVLCDERDYAKASVLVLPDGPILVTQELFPENKQVSVRVALSPSVGTIGSSWFVPDQFRRYGKDIALGALASLKSLAGEMGESDRFAVKFASRTATVAAVSARSLTGHRIGHRNGRQIIAQFF